MGMDGFEFAYLVCFFLGLGFAILSGLLAGVFGGGAEAHIDAGGHHMDMGHGVEGHVHFPILSPVTIAMAVLTFGGAGLLFKKFLHWPAGLHLTGALVCAVAMAFLIAWLLYQLFSATQSTSHATAEEAVGLDAEVTVAIPHQGLGEIAYVLRGVRMLNPARTLDGKELPPQTPVKIVKLTGNTYFVEKAKA